MLYIIGGPPRAGKSVLAKRLAKEKSCSWVSLDYIASVITPYIPKEEQINQLPLSTARTKTQYDNDVFYAKYSPQEVVDFYIRQAETYWPGMKNFLEYLVSEGHDFVVEGWQIFPHHLHTLISSDNKEKMRIFFLFKDDPKDILAGFKASKEKNDWVIKNTKEESTFSAIAEMVRLFGTYIAKEAKTFGFDAINVSSDFENTIESVSKSQR